MAQYAFSMRDQSLGITWAKLHQEICCNPDLCKKTMKQKEFMDKMFMRVSDTKSDTHIKGELYITAFAPERDTESSSVKKYIGYMYYAKDGIHSRFKNVRDYFITQKNKSGEDWDYKTHPDIVAFKSIWEELIPVSGPDTDYNEPLELAIDEVLRNIPDTPLQLMERLSALNDAHEYSLTLAILSAIASTLFCFGCGKPFEENDFALQDLILPPLPKHEESLALEKARELVEEKKGTLKELEDKLVFPLKTPFEKGEANYLLAKRAYQLDNKKLFEAYLNKAVECGNKKAIRLKNEERAIKLLARSRSIFYGSEQTDPRFVKECCENCQKILHFSPSVDENYRGEASYMLYKYIKIGLYISPSGETAQDYLSLSHRLGYPLAKDDWNASNNVSVEPQYERPETANEGTCFVNTRNIYSETFAKTIPHSWNDDLTEFNLESIEKIIYDNCHCRFLFIDDHPLKNMQDFFSLLQLIKDSSPESVEYYEVFIRHDFEKAKPLVDTALSHLANYKIAVYILDDDKQAAQQLLSFHPLFYPVKSINFNLPAIQTGQERPILNFTVLGDTRVAEWLVREAFWMMGFKDDLIENRITVLANAGEQFVMNIKSQYPGMARGNLNIDGIEFPDIKGIDIDYSSPALYRQIAELLNVSRYNYFVVATDSDEENLSLAMKVKELLIRNSVFANKKQEFIVPSPVAFLCKDDNLSWLSKELVVEQEAEGDRWFNTWNLIPFGEISKRYSWNNITGGTFEELARCIHYQYNGVTLDDVINQTEHWKKATHEYYLRQYNQDSSYSSALSMPYRIFQFQDDEHNQIIPAAWSICQSTVFSSVNQLKALSNRFSRFLSSKERANEEQKIAEWEHARWVKWMISRGWMPASIDDVVFAYENGNPRPQLFVAKLHPCICSYYDLKILQDELSAKCGMNKDFFTYDLLNIRDTQKLLSLEWLHPTSKEKAL